MKSTSRGWIFTLLSIVSVLVLIACRQNTAYSQTHEEESTFTILQRWSLPSDLREISGISFYGNLLAAIQDEDGIIFLINPKTGQVERRISFGPAGDYEGIAIVGETAWILRSDGQLFEAKDFAQTKPNTIEHVTGLKKNVNMEGLFYDRPNNRLLLSVKDKDPQSKDSKGVYAYDLKSNTLATMPVYQLSAAQTQTSGKKKSKQGAFRPSDLAIHPSTGAIYVLDGPANRLYVMDKNGQVQHFYSLNKQNFPKAEGLAFTADGTLYISTEGGKKDGALLKVRLDS